MRKWQVPVGETPEGKVSLMFCVFEGEKPGPTLGIMSGVHGHEISSIDGLRLFVEDLKKIPVEDFYGKIVALPFANPLALRQRTWGFRMSSTHSEENLNRQFPGDPRGSIGERIAHTIVKLFTETHKVDLFIDLHTMPFRSLPFVIVDRVRCTPEIIKRTWQYAEQFGLGVVHDMPPGENEKLGLQNCSTVPFLKKSTPAFTVEVPGLNFSLPASARMVQSGLWNMARHLGIFPKDRYLFWQDPSRMLIGVGALSRAPRIRAEKAGFFYPAVEVGTWIKEGGRMGEILDKALDCIETVRSPMDGLIANIEDVSVVSTGDELFELFVPEKKEK